MQLLSVKMLVLPLAMLALVAAEAQAIKITQFTDTDTFVKRAQDIVVAKCTGPVPDSQSYDDGLYPVEVEITAVLKGTKEPGKAIIATIYPMEVGKTYMLTSLGGSAHGTDILAVPQLAVIELPPTFRLDDLKGKKVAEQVQAVFVARRQENKRRSESDEELLDKAVSK